MEPTEQSMASLQEAPARPLASRLSLSGQRLLLSSALIATDALVLLVAFRAAFWIRFDLQVTLAPEVVPRLAAYQELAALLVPVWLLVFVIYDLYDPYAKLGGIQESSKTFNACTMATMLVIVGTFVFPQVVISRMYLVSVWLLSFLLVATCRFAARRVVYAFRRRGYLLSPAVIVGTNQEAVSLARFLGDQHASGVRLLGHLTTGLEDQLADSVPVVGPAEDIQSIVKEHGIEDVIVAITALSRERLLRLSELVDPLPVQLRLSSGLYELLTTRVQVRTLGTVPLLSLHKVRLGRGEAVIKSLLDTSVAVTALAVLSPVLLAIAIWVKLDSPGPVLYRRRVLGRSGRQFDAFKFRTMHVDGDVLLIGRLGAAEELRNNHKLKDDPRITRAGRVLRKFSLDELPQLVNVLLGQMSLVGPRMVTPDEAAKYGRQRMNLLTVKPGITGLWQVSGRSDLTYEERVRIDMYYVRTYSVWLDLQILFIQTLPAVIRGRGAY